jgi:signal peptidase I
MTTSVQKRQHELSIIRDTVESVWVAIILAFVLRAFMVEAFVIPTGSMAPRLMGEHYDLICSACGYEYSYGWESHGKGSVNRGTLVSPEGASCPTCTYRFSTPKQHVNGGDRVLVMKYLYRFVEPKPFDVVVFRNPQSNANNYIKRLIGLPGETIEIVHGDVFVIGPGQRQDAKGAAKIRRKPDRAQAVMWQIINDNDYQPDLAKLKAEGTHIDAPRRWAQPEAGGKTQSGLWKNTDNGRTFMFKGSEERSYLTFKGVREVVGYVDSDNLESSKTEAENSSMCEAFLPQYGYNSNQRPTYLKPEIDLCSDLKVSMVVKPGADKASAECVLDGMWFSVRAVFDTDGAITVYRRQRELSDEIGTTLPKTDANGWETWATLKTSPMSPSVGRKVELAHVDHGVKIWVDGGKVFDKDYSISLARLKKRLETAADTPLPIPGARIGGKDGPLEFAHLKLMRDVYYTDFQLGRSDSNGPNFLTDYAGNLGPHAQGWGVKDNPIELTKNDEDPDLDEFFVLGDNSPQSLDSRGWIEAAPSLRLYGKDKKRQYKLGTVPRYNMIGKAMFVYWPSGYRLPLLPSLPIVPDVGRMRLIR